MITFHCGFNKEQVEKLQNNEKIIFPKIPVDNIYVPRKNTFDYIPRYMYEDDSIKAREIKEYISNDMYNSQYIFLSKYLGPVLSFCNTTKKRNYIMACDIDEEILKRYSGIGGYDKLMIEYRLPRIYIKSDNILDFIYFEPFDDETIDLLISKYEDNIYISSEEEEKAKKLMQENNLVFNYEKSKVKSL